MHLKWTLIVLSFFLFAGSCEKEQNSTSTSACSFDLTGDLVGSYGGGVGSGVGGSLLNYMCGDGLGFDYPVIRVVIDGIFAGAGTYDLTLGAFVSSITVDLDAVTSYVSDNTSTNCEAVFTKTKTFTVTCDGIPKVGGGGTISVSNGSYTFED